jgi:hypothetical protein
MWYQQVLNFNSFIDIYNREVLYRICFLGVILFLYALPDIYLANCFCSINVTLGVRRIYKTKYLQRVYLVYCG